MAYNDSRPGGLVSGSRLAKALAKRAILKTLAYSDIFDFPLTKPEIWKFLDCPKKINKSLFEESLQRLIKKQISEIDSFYCLIGREEIISKRKSNASEVNKKFKIAQKVAMHLAKIPTIMFIGISGGLAMEDAEQEDDIDLFIITKKDKLYTTRFFVLTTLENLKIRRRRNDRNPADKICVNFLIDETELAFQTDRMDLYTGHEIAQIKPLFQRSNIYSKFLEANSWMQNVLPNFESVSSYSRERENLLIPHHDRDDKVIIIFKILNIFWLENLTRLLQTAYMRNHKKNEIVTKHIIGFHPTDYRVHTLKNLRLKYQQLGLLTNT